MLHWVQVGKGAWTTVHTLKGDDMATAFEVQRMQSCVAQAYAFLCQCSDEATVKQIPVLRLLDPTPAVMEAMVYHPRRHLAAQVLRTFFTPPQGQQAALVLGHAREAALTHTVDTEEKQVSYGIDKLGPLRFTVYKKRRFFRKKPAMVERISFEALCLQTDRPHDAVTATFQLIDATVQALLPAKK